MKNKWKIILICLFMLPCVVFFDGCSCSCTNNKSNGNGGQYSNIYHSVSFYTGSEDTFNVQTQNIQHGGKVKKPSDPRKEGFAFQGWYVDEECTIRWRFDSDVVTKQLTLYALWEEMETESNVFTVIFFTNSSDTVSIPNQRILRGGLVTRPIDPIKTGYVFEGWFKNEELTRKWDFGSDVVTANTYLYARWKKL